MRGRQGSRRPPVFGQFCTTRMAASAGFELGSQWLQCTAPRIPGFGVDCPRRLGVLVERNRKAFVGIGVLVLRPGHMPGPGAMASLAGNVDLGPGGAVVIFGGV